MIGFLRRIFKTLTARPWVSAMAIATIGLSIGSNTAIYSLVDTLYFKYLPVPHSDEIVAVYGIRSGNASEMALPIDDYRYYKEHSTTFSGLAAHYSTSPVYLAAQDGESQLVLGAVVSGNYFSVLQLRPVLGRFFAPEEGENTTQYPVAVINYRLWQNRFSSDPGIVGKTIKMNGVNFTVVGVAPKDFQGVFPSFVNDVWMPLSMASVGFRICNVQDRKCTFLGMFGRLAPGHNLQQAQSEMSGLAEQINIAYPSSGNAAYKGVTVSTLRGLRPTSRPAVSNMVRLLVIAGMVVLLIAAANLSGLLLAQGIYRSKEMALKLALGAKRRHIIGQLLGEAAVLSILGSAIGLGLATLANNALARFLFVGDDGRPTLTLDINSHVLVFTLLVVVCTMLLFALVPALINSRPHLTLVLKDQESLGGFHKSRLRQMLVASQIGLSLVLLISAVLLIKSLNHILDGPGFETSRIAVLRVSPVRLAYTPDKSQAFLREVLRRLEGLPEVEHISMGQGMPWWLPKPWEITLPEQTAAREEDKILASMNPVTTGYFQTMGIPLLQGHDFSASDTKATGSVAILNESLANRLWPHENPLGRVMVVSGEQFTVIGIARDAQYRSAADGQRPFFYTSYWQQGNGVDGRLYVRSKADAHTVLQRIHKVIVDVDPDVPISEEMTLTDGVRRTFDSVLLTRNVLSAAGVIALFLSMIGLYAVIAFAVAQRTKEIGIRTALGAQRSNILYLVLREGFGLALLGAVMGIVGTVVLVRFLASLLYGVNPFDMVTFIAVPVILIVLAAIASYIPAINATRISPLVAIRHE